MALINLGLSSGCVRPVHSHSSSDIPPSQHILGHAGTSATSLMSQIPSQGNGSPGKAGIPSGQEPPGLINTGKVSLGFGTAQPGHAPSGDTKNPSWEHGFCLKSGNRTAQSSLKSRNSSKGCLWVRFVFRSIMGDFTPGILTGSCMCL